MARLHTFFSQAVSWSSLLTAALALPSAPIIDSRQSYSVDNGTFKNPIVPGFYADPDAVKFGDTYWIYPTTSAGGGGGPPHIDAFSSKDLKTWTKHPNVFTSDNSDWVDHDIWAPSAVKRGDKYYLYYAANAPPGDNGEPYGIGVAVSSSPAGPFIDPINKPLIGSFINGSDPIDQQIFQDPQSGKDYIIYGNTKAMIAPIDVAAHRINFKQMRDITPHPRYFEAPFFFYEKGWYYFMYSLGAFNMPDYRVEYASSRSLFGPFTSKRVVLKDDGKVADGPGHNAVVKDAQGNYLCVYHRRIIGDAVAGHRVLAIDKMTVHDGIIDPIVMT
jgi:beta-xylosidase